MYRAIVMTLLFVLISAIGKAQTFKKVAVSNSIEMNTRRNEVWTVLSDLTNLDVLVPEIISKTETVGSGKGALVTLTLKSNGLKVVEHVIELDNDKHTLVYEMIETPMPISGYKATIKIIPTNSNDYKIRFDAVFKVQEENRETMVTTIGNFQKMLLSNIKKTYSDEE